MSHVAKFWLMVIPLELMVFAIMLVAALGCAVAEKQGGVVFDQFAQRFDDLDVKLIELNQTVSAGRDVNEPITGWILAIGTMGLLLVDQTFDWLRGRPRTKRTRKEDNKNERDISSA